MKSQSVLLVEDNEDDIYFMRRAFSQTHTGHALTVVSDGREAIKYLAGEDQYKDRLQYPVPRMLLLDLKLPLVSGIDVLRWIRKESPFRHLVVVIFSSSNQESDIESAYRAGANSYLVKTPLAENFSKTVELIYGYWLSLNEHPCS